VNTNFARGFAAPESTDHIARAAVMVCVGLNRHTGFESVSGAVGFSGEDSPTLTILDDITSESFIL
jgi:hypothetical protein